MALTREQIESVIEDIHTVIRDTGSITFDGPGALADLAELCRFWLAHQWQPIETAPKDNGENEMILWVPDLGERPAYWDEKRNDWFSPIDDLCQYDDATHWRRYSDPPKETP